MVLRALVPQGVFLSLVPGLSAVARVALSVAVVGDVGLDVLRFEALQVRFAVIAGIGHEHGV